MWTLTLTLSVLAAAPPAARAGELAGKRAWDELYLAYSAVAADGYPEAERARIGKAMDAGCSALQKRDAVMAYSLGELGRRFAPSARGLLCLARAAGASDQRGAAEAALREGAEKFPKEDAFRVELGRLLLDERDAEGAMAVLAEVSRSSKHYGPAQRLLKKARTLVTSERAALRQAERLERKVARGEPTGVQPASGTGSLSFESGVGPGGMRTRSNARFTIKYFNNQRDFGQRAEYEGRIVAALDEADETSREVLGVTRSAPVDVILYTQDEFAAHFSAQTARRVAGLYFMDAIRINDAAEVTAGAKATLVHEYVHAVLDDLVSGQSARIPRWLHEGIATYVEWRYLGHEGPPHAVRARLRALARAGASPRLRDMDRGAPIGTADPAAAYAASGVAIGLLVSRGGTSRLLDLVRDVGAGSSFEGALLERYGRSLDQLETDLKGELARR